MTERAEQGLAVMPAFEDLGGEHPQRFAEADAWRAIHAPARRGRTESAAPAPPSATRDVESPVDTSVFLVPTENFDAWVIDEAENVVKIQYGLYQHACKSGDQYRIRTALDNWEVAARRCADLRARFLELRERAAGMIQLDRASDIVGRELGLLQQLLDDFGRRVGTKANPDKPETAVAAIDEEMDAIYRQIENAKSSITHAASEQQVA